MSEGLDTWHMGRLRRWQNHIAVNLDGCMPGLQFNQQRLSVTCYNSPVLVSKVWSRPSSWIHLLSNSYRWQAMAWLQPCEDHCPCAEH